uniref:Gonadotropin subunit beta-2 n=1 Tax=Osphronemus goramy TaxID=270604 RepID=A0A8F2JDF5_9TELE|nr:luteinizing hormone [Osphronemus goramy]
MTSRRSWTSAMRSSAGLTRTRLRRRTNMNISNKNWRRCATPLSPSCTRVLVACQVGCPVECQVVSQELVIPFSNVYQHVCTYRDLFYKTFEFPDCPPGVDPVVTYPVALSCHCGRCVMDTSDCTFESLQPDFCMNDIPFYY